MNNSAKYSEYRPTKRHVYCWPSASDFRGNSGARRARWMERSRRNERRESRKAFGGERGIGEMSEIRSRRPEPLSLTLEPTTIDDPKLPQPRGRIGRKPKENPDEVTRLRRVKNYGGLVSDQARSQSQCWMCPECETVHNSRPEAAACHRRTPNQVCVCNSCGKRLHLCGCPKREWK